MTLKERVIVETYTGVCMTTGDERNELYKYMEGLLGRPVWTHELACKEGWERLKEKARSDFKALCISEKSWDEAKKNVWVLLSKYFERLDIVYSSAKKAVDLMERYNNGERTAELYEAMVEAK